MSRADALDQVFREQWGRVLAVLVGLLGDVDLAEEAAQEAFAVAAERWPRDGVPGQPAGWLVTTARNRAIDRVRRDRTLAGEDGAAAAPGGRTTEEVEVRTSPTSGSSSSSRAATRRWPSTRRWRSPCAPSAG